MLLLVDALSAEKSKDHLGFAKISIVVIGRPSHLPVARRTCQLVCFPVLTSVTLLCSAPGPALSSQA